MACRELAIKSVLYLPTKNDEKNYCDLMKMLS